jgi:hypothetical protein
VLHEGEVWLRDPPPWHPLIVAYGILFGLFALIAAAMTGLDSGKAVGFSTFLAVIGLVPLLANLSIPGVEAQITREAVRVTLLRRLPIGPTGWTEPLSGYRGLRACMVRWTDPPQTYDAKQVNPTLYSHMDGPVWKSDPSMASKRREGQLLLEHATDPDRTLLLVRRDGKAIETAVAQDLAARIGVPLRWTA